MRKSNPSSIDYEALGASFRDPAGFIYKDTKGSLLRQVNSVGAADYDYFMKVGLYKHLVEKHLLIKHKQVSLALAATADAYAIIKPERIPYISYPFEWSFSQLKDAALLTLRVQKIALKYGMTLKDASAYNVQFVEGKPVFIDTLSFEKYEPGKPWQAYRQFCQHFLAPLALMAHTDIDLSQLFRVQLDGINLELALKLLPRRAKVRPGIAMHLVLHGKAQKAKEYDHKVPSSHLSLNGLNGILESLGRTIRKLKLSEKDTEWGDYYDKTNYTAGALDKKAKLIEQLVKPLSVSTAIDLGGNNGRYSRVLNKLGVATVCTDIDPNAVESNYLYLKEQNETMMLPLLVDITNPGGALGWSNEEREPISNRLKTDMVVALALIHHLAISNNLPFSKIAGYFKLFAPYLLIEFVPKEDSQVKKLLSTRKDIFPAYTKEGFVAAFKKEYKLLESVKIPSTKRELYLFKRK